MKTMSKRAWVLYVFIAAFLAGLIVLFYTFYTNADSWAMKKANRHLYSSGTLSVAGSIKDETGAVLAETKDGKRVYNSDKTVRTATMHTVGDSEGYIATGVQTSYKDVITGYNFVDGIYNLKKYGKGNDVNLTINAQLCAAAYSALGSNK
nr:penicillin-binding protein [Candidatus Fimenecus sp.]